MGEMIKKKIEKDGYLGKDKMEREAKATSKKEVNVVSMLKKSKGNKGVV